MLVYRWESSAISIKWLHRKIFIKISHQFQNLCRPPQSPPAIEPSGWPNKELQGRRHAGDVNRTFPSLPLFLRGLVHLPVERAFTAAVWCEGK